MFSRLFAALFRKNGGAKESDHAKQTPKEAFRVQEPASPANRATDTSTQPENKVPCPEKEQGDGSFR